jgi:hypothetical protein
MKLMQSGEYRELATESSNLMLDWDGRWVLGRYEEAVYALLQAGYMRRRMAEMCLAEHEFEYAAEDWLSAAEAFRQVPALELARSALGSVQQIDADGRIPADRKDLHRAVTERAEGIQQLQERIQAFETAIAATGTHGTPGEDKLKFLLSQVRELPGLPALHYEIFRQAEALGQHDLAARHILWATRFDPDNEDYLTHHLYRLIEGGQFDEAEGLARTFLVKHADARRILIPLALIPIYRQDDTPEARQKAIETLRPLVEDSPLTDVERMVALYLTVHLLGDRGRREQVSQEMRMLEESAHSKGNRKLAAALAEFRITTDSLLSQSSPGNGAPTSNGAFDRGFFRLVEQLTTAA